MPDRDQPRSLETFLCGIWADPARRAAWKSGFEKLGQLPVVRKTFDEFYLSSSLDGGKIRTFVNAYAANGLKPTEIDYAFFKDRAAHTTPRSEAIRTAIANALSAEPGAERWKIRRAIALNVRPSNQRADRLGRDVTFYLDGAGSGQLSAEERNAWQSRGGLRASDAGLSDAREYASFTPGAAINTSISQPATLTAAERTLCPAAVLATRQP
jgi:hypothetical protein